MADEAPASVDHFHAVRIALRLSGAVNGIDR